MDAESRCRKALFKHLIVFLHQPLNPPASRRPASMNEKIMDQERHIFVSVGGTANSQQEDFVRAVEDRLRGEGMIPHTVGRNTFSSDAPLKAVTELMKKCSGAVVIALERSFFPSGISKRGGPREAVLSEIKLPTPWNQIEAAMAYSVSLPLLVIVEAGLQNEGLLEKGYDWYVQEVSLQSASLATAEFNGVLYSWKQKIQEGPVTPHPEPVPRSPQEMTIGELLGSLKPAQLWSTLAALAALVAGAFLVGSKLLGGK
jgi:hypothetical protein